MFKLLIALALSAGTSQGSSGASPCTVSTLRTAASQGELAVVRSCLGRGADADSPATNGVTLLMIAAAGGHASVVRLLLENGASIDAVTTEDEITALMFGAAFGHIDVVKVLAEQGKANLDRTDRGRKRAAVHWAVAHPVIDALADGKSKERAKSDSDAIVNYLKTRGVVVREVSIIHGILMFAGPPDLPALLKAAP